MKNYLFQELIILMYQRQLTTGFIHEYLPENEKLIYVDCDVLCINYSEYEVEKIFSEIEKII